MKSQTKEKAFAHIWVLTLVHGGAQYIPILFFFFFEIKYNLFPSSNEFTEPKRKKK